MEKLEIRMVNVLGESAPSYATVKNRIAECKRGPTSIQDGLEVNVQKLQQRQKS